MKGFNNFVQVAVNARREEDENPSFNVVAETMKLLANSSDGYQILHWSQHTVAKYLSFQKLHGAINNKLFTHLNYTNDQLYQVDLVKSEIEHKEANIFGFFNLQYARLRMLEL